MVKRLNDVRSARDAGYQNIQYLRKDFTFADGVSVLTIGTVPAGGVIIRPISGVDVQEAFNNGTNNRLNVGNATTADLYGTLLALGTLAFVPLDEVVSLKMAADTTILVTLDQTGTAATTGKGSIIIAYVPEEG